MRSNPFAMDPKWIVWYGAGIAYGLNEPYGMAWGYHGA